MVSIRLAGLLNARHQQPCFLTSFLTLLLLWRLRVVAPQAKDSQRPTLRSYQEAACQLAAHVLAPSAEAAAAGEPAQVALYVHNPRVILVRRFMNNVLYVMALVSHELDAAGKVQEQQQQQRRQRRPAAPAQPSQQQQPQQQHPGPPAIFLLTMTGVQVGSSTVLSSGQCSFASPGLLLLFLPNVVAEGCPHLSGSPLAHIWLLHHLPAADHPALQSCIQDPQQQV